MDNQKLIIAKDQNIITEETLAAIISYRERLIDNNIPVIYNLRHIRKIFKIRHNEQDLFFGDRRSELYRTFEITKKSGGKRKIEAPNERLKNIQRWIKDEILDAFPVSNYATGFRKDFSIVDNARKHVGKELVINMDIKDFFPSVSYADVLRLFVYFGYKLDVAHLLTKLCTNSENVLPQGSPASPAISNLVLLKLDKRLGKLAESIGCDYSRYADDLTFSGNKSLKSVVPLVERIVVEEGYWINQKKTRFQYSNQRQDVTGLVVNSKISVMPELKNEIKNAIYFCKKHGVSNHMTHIGCDKSFYREHLYGIAFFIKMVDQTAGERYLRALDEINWQ